MSVFNKRREFVRFILVGVLATATHYGIYFFLCVLMLPAIAYTIGYAISFILNFYLSKRNRIWNQPFCQLFVAYRAIVIIYMDRSPGEMGTSSCVCISSTG